MTIENETLIVRTINLDPAKLRRAMQLSDESLKAFMGQARAITHLATHWVEQAFGVPVKEESPGSLILPHPILSLSATIRSFSRGNIQFQQSKRSGVFRDNKSSRGDMIDDATKVDYFMVCDLRAFPRIDIYPLRSAKVLNYIHSRDVGKNGITPREFDRFIAENFRAEYVDYTHSDFMRVRRRARRRKGSVPVTQLKR